MAGPRHRLEQIRACAKAAAVDDFIQSLPHGYDTLLGERGLTLSVGERQRIALARALLNDPPILILDEPTSALDPTSETAIISDFNRVLRGRTAILITHRMTLVELADMVVVIDEGTVVAAGRPSELLAQEGFLARQFQLSRISPRNEDVASVLVR